MRVRVRPSQKSPGVMPNCTASNGQMLLYKVTLTRVRNRPAWGLLV